MSAHFDPGVERRLDSPSDEARVSLIVGVEDTESGTLDSLRGAGAEVEDVLPCDYVAVSIQETDLDNIISLSSVTSLEVEVEGETLEDPDF